MGYGYGTGFVKATSDIPIINLKIISATFTPGEYVNFRVMDTNVHYNVPTTKTGLIALTRVTLADANRLSDLNLGYADDATGTNFVQLVSLRSMGISNPPEEVYWVFRIPAGKFVGIKHMGSVNTAANTIFMVIFEV